MPARVGVFICECGPNIKTVVDVEAIAAYASDLPDVVLSRTFGLMCAQAGQDLLRTEIEQNQLNRIVIAGCTPKEHEHTFRQILEAAGVNPFMLQIANLREQCAWVHADHTRATQKARRLVQAAVMRVVQHEPIEVQTIASRSEVMVIGAGVAGLSAALMLAQHDRQVFLIEKEPCIGGRVALLEDIYPNLACAACELDPMMDEVLHSDNIEVLCLSEVQEVTGYYGNFKIKVKSKARSVDTVKCIGCGMCLAVCPVKTANAFNAGLDDRGAIYLPYPGALPHIALIDRANCLRYKGETCEACRQACQFDAIDFEEQDHIRHIDVGAVVLATGYDLFDPHNAPQYNYDRHNEVYTAFEFERLLNPNGPTEGRIAMRNGHPPHRIAFIPCVGSRSERYNPYCSGICCRYNLKYMQQVQRRDPDVEVLGLFADLCLPGKTAQEFFNQVSALKGIKLDRLQAPDTVEIARQNEALRVQYIDASGKSSAVTADMVVLAPALQGPRDAEQLANAFDIETDDAGFFIEVHQTLAPVATVNDGVFIAGCAQGPKNIPDAVAQGQAAAGQILSRLRPGTRLALEPLAAEIDTALCSGCRLCVDLCPYKALQVDKASAAVAVEPTLCRGCGICAAACPAGAIKAHHFCDRTIIAELRGLVPERR